MFRRAITRRIFTRGAGSADDLRAGRGSDPGKDRLGRQLETRSEVDLRPVAERLARGRDVRPRVADVTGARRLESLLDGLPEDRADRLGEVVHTRRRGRADVEG